MSWFFQAPAKKETYRLDLLEDRIAAINAALEHFNEKLKAVDYLSVVIPEEYEEDLREVLSGHDKELMGDVRSFQVGNTLVTSRIGVIEIGKTRSIGGDDIYIDMKVPFAVLVAKPLAVP